MRKKIGVPVEKAHFFLEPALAHWRADPFWQLLSLQPPTFSLLNTQERPGELPASVRNNGEWPRRRVAFTDNFSADLQNDGPLATILPRGTLRSGGQGC